MDQILTDADFADDVLTDADFEPEQPKSMFAGISTNPVGPLALLDSLAQSDPQKALGTNAPVEGFINKTIRGLPAGLGSAIGGTGGAAFGFGVGAVPGAGIGAAAGEGARQAYVNYSSLKSGGAPTPAGDALGNIAEQGAMGAAAQAAAPYIANAARGALTKGAQMVADVAEYAGKNIAGIKPQSYAFAKEFPEAVAKYMQATPDVADDIAGSLRTNVSKAVDAGEQAYKSEIQTVLSNKKYGPGFRLNIMDAVGDDLAAIKKDFGYGMPGRFGANGRGADIFNFVDRTLQKNDVTLEAAYYLQKDLHQLASDNAGTTLGVALGKASEKIGGYLAKKVPELEAANSAYHAAKTIESMASKAVNADDVIGLIDNVYGKERNTLLKQRLDVLGQLVPEAGQAIHEARAYMAAKSMSPVMRSLPQTGMGASIAAGFVRDPLAAGMATQYVTGNPLVAAGVAAGTAVKNVAASPLANYYGMRGAEALQRPAYRVGTAIKEGIEQYGAPALQQAYFQARGAR